VNRRLRLAAFALAALALGPGCSKPSDAPDAARKPPASIARSGLRIPLPEGWTVEPVSSQVFTFGPPGRAVLRVERHKSEAEIPSPQALVEEFSKHLEPSRAALRHGVSVEGFTAAVMDLQPQTKIVVLGLRRVGRDVLMCSSTILLEEQDIDSAIRCCREISPASP
jgi:hypothetical protein